MMRYRLPSRCTAIALVLLASIAACDHPAPGPPQTGTPRANAPVPRSATTARPSPLLVAAARAQVGVTVRYDPAYARIDYPGGDVAPDRGVCTDVVIRALRAQGIDLQREIHVDRGARRSAYPDRGAVLDRNIDHRRVPNQMAWFRGRGWDVPVTAAAGDYLAGDIVAWRLRGSGLLHIGIVSDRGDRDGVPLVLHNIGAGTREEPLLFEHAVIGHYRPAPERFPPSRE